MKDRLFFGKKFCAVELSFDEEGNDVLYCLQLFKNKEELEIKKANKFFDIGVLLEELKKEGQNHVVLVVNNKQVLSKVVDPLNDEELLLFKKAFPSLSSNDFHVQTNKLLNHINVSVVRKTYVEDLIKEFSNYQIEVLDILIGNATFSVLEDVIDSNKIYTSNAELLIDDKRLEAVKQKRFNQVYYNINGLRISGEYVLSLSAIVSFYLTKNIAYNNKLFTDFKERKIFNLGYKIALGVIFIMVLANFIFFNKYNVKVNNLNQQLEVKKNVKLKLKKLKTDVKKKKKLLAELQNSSSFSVSKYADQVVLEMPNSIILSEIIYQPLLRPLKKKKETSFKTKEIEIKGVLHNYEEFTQWIDNIEKKSWVKELLELTTEKEKRKKNSSFHILILVE